MAFGSPPNSANCLACRATAYGVSFLPRAFRHSVQTSSRTPTGAAAGCALAIGMGEAPLLRQATFSLWENTAAMDAYARTGAHLDAIRAAWKHEFFSESMFVRFAPIALQGQWKGRDYG